VRLPKRDWWKRRAEAALDSVVGWVVVVGVVAAVASLVAFGSHPVPVKGWEVTLVVVVLLALAVGEVVLFGRTKEPTRQGATPDRPTPSASAALLVQRLVALETDLAPTDPTRERVRPELATVWNELLDEATYECPGLDQRTFKRVELSPDGNRAFTNRAALYGLVRQVRILVESS
jgi:hypothetical protein